MWDLGGGRKCNARLPSCRRRAHNARARRQERRDGEGAADLHGRHHPGAPRARCGAEGERGERCVGDGTGSWEACLQHTQLTPLLRLHFAAAAAAQLSRACVAARRSTRPPTPRASPSPARPTGAAAWLGGGRGGLPAARQQPGQRATPLSLFFLPARPPPLPPTRARTPRLLAAKKLPRDTHALPPAQPTLPPRRPRSLSLAVSMVTDIVRGEALTPVGVCERRAPVSPASDAARAHRPRACARIASPVPPAHSAPA